MTTKELSDKKQLSSRKKAEELLRKNKQRCQNLSSDDMQTLIYELQIHQIELEMQNDELRKAHEIIENSQKRYTDLYNYSPIGYLTTNIDGVVVEVNTTALKLLQYDKQSVIGKPFAVFVNRSDLDYIYQHLHYLRSGQSHTCQIMITKHDRSTFFAELMSVPFMDYETKTDQFLITLLDITERKHIFETRSQLASIVDGTDDAIISENLVGTIVSWNNGAEKLYGFTEKEICGEQIAILEQSCNNQMSPVLNFATIMRYESIHKRKDGTPVSVSLTKSPVRGIHGEVIGVSTIVRDITSRKKWEDTIMDLNQQFQISNLNLENIGSTLAHELRNPLQGIISISRMINEDYSASLDECCNQYIEQIHRSAVGMDKMVGKLLEVSRIARSAVDRDKIDLSELVTLIINEFKYKEPDRKINATVQAELIVTGDKTLLHIAMEKILQNAFKFSRKKAFTEIEFGKCINVGKQAYFLSDNGAGFNMENKEKIFNIFQRDHQDSDFEGTGVGLSITQKIILRHGGEIWAEGEVDCGATIYFTLGEEIQ
jgi:PAS domain S-box-containing protein